MTRQSPSSPISYMAPPPSSLRYRADIDGLRAIAVLSVMIYHAWPSSLPGGFIGVDVFFVISGFLITSIILKAQTSPGLFLRTFYERRIRRLIPPALPVICFTLVASWFLMPPDALEEAMRSVLAYSAFVSNWFFLSIAGYFDGSSHLKPLLHTWSLSVEEQFYLLFPLPILLLHRVGRSVITLLFIAVVLISFAYGLFLINSGETDSAFFNSFARFWEIGIGGFLACVATNGPRRMIMRHGIGLLGLTLIAAPMFLIGPDTVFPGLSALSPVIGTALAIYAGLPHAEEAALTGSRPPGLAARILSCPLLVWTGLISYALYLWHWPLFVFLRYVTDTPAGWMFVAAVALTFILSILSYVAIEKPFRSKRVFRTSPRIFAGFAMSTVGIVAVAMPLAFGSIQTGRFDNAEDYLAAHRIQEATWRRLALRGVCHLDHRAEMAAAISRCVTVDPHKKNVLLVGDSHASHLLHGLQVNFPDVNFSLISVDSCLLSDRSLETRPACEELNDWLTNSEHTGFDALMYSSREFAIGLPEYGFAMLSEISKRVPVVLLGPIQYYEPSQPTLYPRMVGLVSDKEILFRFDAAVQPEQAIADQTMASLAQAKPGIRYISLYDITCPSGVCRHFDLTGMPLLADASHLSATSSREITAELASRLPELLTPAEDAAVRFKSIITKVGEGVHGWVAEAGGELSVVATSKSEPPYLRFQLPSDGRLMYKTIVESNEANSKRYSLYASLTLDSFEGENKPIDMILQNGCDHVVVDGASVTKEIKPGLHRYVFQVTLRDPPQCLMLRLWSRQGQSLDARITEFTLKIATRDPSLLEVEDQAR